MRRTVVFMAEMDVSESEAIGKRLAAALREYASDLDNGQAGKYAAEQYMTLDRRTAMRVISGRTDDGFSRD